MTFGQFADEFIEEIAPGFSNEKHIYQWRATVQTYAASLRDKPVAEIGTDDVLAVLRPIWLTKQETASRLRGRIERILDAASAKKLRAGENPARWRGNLKSLLPDPKLATQEHLAAMPYGEVNQFMAELRDREAASARALEFVILTAARTGEVIGATWDEIDLDQRLWTVPKERMKARIEHRVPLSDRALEILLDMKSGDDNSTGSVFPGQRRDRPLSQMAMLMLLRRMKVAVTAHGFRSTFRDWAGDCTDFPRDVAEAALAHRLVDKTEAAYRRGTALEKRRDLMEAWAAFCGSGTHNNT